MSKPRVWFVAPIYGSSSQVWLRRQVLGLSRLDLRVLVQRVENQERVTRDDVQLQLIPAYKQGGRGGALSRTRSAFYSLLNARHGWFRGSPAEADWWLKQIRAYRPEAVLFQFGTTATRLMPLFVSEGVPVVVHFHGHDLSSSLRRSVYRRILINSLPKFARSVVVAEYQREWLQEHGQDPSLIEKIPCGIPLSELAIADKVGQEPCRFLAVGRLVQKKRPDLTIRAFAECARHCSDVTLRLVGDGPMLGECRELVSGLGLDGRVELLGSVPFSEVNREIQNASVFVQHSVTADCGDKEGWPVAIGEAAGSGLPVISTRHASIPEQIEDGVTGLLCDEGDWRAMGGHMVRLARSSSERAEMGKRARIKLAAFDSDGQIKQLEEVLLAVAAEAGRPAV